MNPALPTIASIIKKPIIRSSNPSATFHIHGHGAGSAMHIFHKFMGQKEKLGVDEWNLKKEMLQAGKRPADAEVLELYDQLMGTDFIKMVHQGKAEIVWENSAKKVVGLVVKDKQTGEILLYLDRSQFSKFGLKPFDDINKTPFIHMVGKEN